MRVQRISLRGLEWTMIFPSPLRLGRMKQVSVSSSEVYLVINEEFQQLLTTLITPNILTILR